MFNLSPPPHPYLSLPPAPSFHAAFWPRANVKRSCQIMQHGWDSQASHWSRWRSVKGARLHHFPYAIGCILSVGEALGFIHKTSRRIVPSDIWRSLCLHRGAHASAPQVWAERETETAAVSGGRWCRTGFLWKRVYFFIFTSRLWYFIVTSYVPT